MKEILNDSAKFQSLEFSTDKQLNFVLSFYGKVKDIQEVFIEKGSHTDLQ